MSNPNIDPHTYEASPQVAQTVSTAQLVVQNGAGYDGFMETIEVATPSSTRRVIDVQSLLGCQPPLRTPSLVQPRHHARGREGDREGSRRAGALS